MSTVRPTEADDPGAPLQSESELLDVFRSAEKPRARWVVGTEHEKFGFMRADHSPLPYFGDNGIEAMLLQIAREERGWTPALDGGHVIALFHEDGSSITLEPGGQFELSGAPVKTIHETCHEVGRHLQLLRRVCLPRGIGFIGMGFHPTATWEQMPLVPKSRYAVMERYMPRVGARGLDMMKRTCTVQANYDWADEQDFVHKFRAALAIQPLVAALFANSPFVEGKVTGALSERQRVWADTDRARGGFPQCVLDDDFSYAKYLSWVLDVPMYFVRRNGAHHDVAGASFRTFMKDGLLGHKATMRDFTDHLTTIFPEVRAKKVLEVRSADCGPWSRIAALPALHKGVLYDGQALAETWALMQKPTSDELWTLREDVATHGYRASYRGQSVLSLCDRLLQIAKGGLARIGDKDERGNDETGFLKTLEDSVARKETFAERLVRKLREDWNGDLTRLWEEVEFFHEDETRELTRPSRP
jgi:glutamate--cysteine ligase